MRETSARVEVAADDIPGKRYFTIGEVADLCGLKAHVLRYWEQEFPQLNPVKRRGNRRYYQREDVLLIRTIRTLLYEEGFTIQGARQQLERQAREQKQARQKQSVLATLDDDFPSGPPVSETEPGAPPGELLAEPAPRARSGISAEQLRELREVAEEARELLRRP